MKNLFTEKLEWSTYHRAAEKLKKMGHVKKAERIIKHHEFIRRIEEKERIKKKLQVTSDVAPFELTARLGKIGDTNMLLDGRFLFTDIGSGYDMFYDNDFTYFSLPFFFAVYEKGQDISESYQIVPFWITLGDIPESFYDVKDDDSEPEMVFTDDATKLKITVEGPSNVEETPWDLTEWGNMPILFTSRKDANRFIKVMKTHTVFQNDIDRITALPNIEKDVMDRVLKCFDYIVTNINPKILYRED